MKKFLIFKIPIIFTFLLINVSHAYACSCAGSNNMCGVFQNADSVFIAEVLNESKLSEPAKLNVIENLKGNTPSQISIKRSGSCSFGFKAGEKYLVYAQRYKKDNSFFVHVCGGSKPLKMAEKELGYLRRMIAGENISLIYGKVFQATEKKEPRYNSLGNIELTLNREFIRKSERTNASKESKKERRIFTDNDGNYIFEGLSKGSYKLKISLPNGLTARREKISFRTYSPMCSQISFLVQIDGRISGVIKDSTGKPIMGKYVRVFEKDFNKYKYIPSIITDKNGFYEIKGIPPGKYQVITSPFSKRVGLGFPFSSFYFPGTLDKSNAQIIDLQYAEKVKDINFQLLPTPKKRVVNVEVRWQDGTIIKPPNVHYRIISDKVKSSLRYAYPNKEGLPIVRVYSGFKYEIYAFGALKDGRLYETDKLILDAENIPEIVKLKARLRR